MDDNADVRSMLVTRRADERPAPRPPRARVADAM